MQNYTLTRSKRKTIAIYVHDGIVEVSSPLKTPKSEIDKFVKSKEKWIENTLAKSAESKNQRENFTLNYSSQILYRGNEFPIVSRLGNHAMFDDDRFCVPANLTSEQIKQACVRIYKLLAEIYIGGRVFEFSNSMDVTVGSVKINSAKTRWGSCSGRKSLNFSWRLIMADDDVIDYVVVHELAHITEMNHSERFWAIVEGILPDYRERKLRLKSLQKRLCGEDWG